MTDEAALLAAILADPKEDTPRLVYADWLTENGQPERAEFIRVQCEWDRLFPNVETCPRKNRSRHPKSCLYCATENRCRLLLTRHYKEWLGPLADIRGEMRFGRGFVVKVESSWADWLTYADAIRAAHPVERVKLTTIPPADVEYTAPFTVAEIDAENAKSDDMTSGRHIRAVLRLSWPGIAFELPPPDYGQQILDATQNPDWQQGIRDLGRILANAPTP